jgi:hypothetical protein
MENKTEERKMYRGNWKCGQCGKGISSLPFDPNPARIAQLRCWDCHQKMQNDQREEEENE